MAKTRLKPLCKHLKEQLVLRAEQQLKEAISLLAQQGKLHSYTALNSEGKQQQWLGCISSWGIVVRIDEETGSLVYHHHAEWWYNVWGYRENVEQLANCADHLLCVAYGIKD